MNIKIGVGLAILLAVLAGGVFFFRVPIQHPVEGKLQVSTSFYPLYFFASQIGGDKASVSNITPAGVEPHDYEPTAQDVARIEKGQLVIVNGGIEAWADRIKQNINPDKTHIVVAGEGLTSLQVMEDGETVVDPHVWLSPRLAKQMVATIEAAFIQADPAHGSYYTANAEALKAKLDRLDQDYVQGLSNCTKKEIITSHAAFGYLAATYGLKQVPITGISPEAEPSPQQLATIAQFAKKNNVKVIFFESLVSPKLSETIANEVNAKTMVLDPIEGLTDDEVAAGKNYLTQMGQNLANLKVALECTQ